ncbi:BatD family protein [Anaerorudis cellulosivorans]|uniref:BatD family protein n=1 Tax=Anaerorudis cellulosivorans TaxID=3397862 RepID=UPI0039B6FFBE
MKYVRKRKIIYVFTALFVSMAMSVNAQVTFRAAAPATVVKGEQFRLTYTLNKEGKDLRLPSDMDGFDVLFGPSVSRSYSQRTVNGKTTSESSVSYTYILVAQKEGTFTIGPATINVDGSTYRSNAVQIKVISPDQIPKSQAQQESGKSGSSSPTIKSTDAFIRAIVSKNTMYEQEGFTVTFRLYTTLNVVDFGKIEFPEFEGFMVEEIELPMNQQLKIEQYNGKSYYTADLRKTLLFPQRSGKITIPSGRIEMVFSVPSGKRISTFFGSQEVAVDVKKTLVTNPVSVNVTPLPPDKPDSFTGAVGSFTFRSKINPQEVKANEPVTFTLEISGTGNLKLIQNPHVEFPSNFEVYDPTVKNELQITTNGLTGTRKIEYIAIPRYEGSYVIPPVEFSYFDLKSRSYKTLKSPQYTVQVAKGDPVSATSNSYVNQQEVKVEDDIRFLKTGKPSFHSRNDYFVGSLAYWLWYIVPLVLFIAFYVVNRKQAKQNANIAFVRNKRANKTAIKRLKVAESYLKQHKQEEFYSEVLRALWGYFSDKLSIPLANLSKDNIEKELTDYDIDKKLIDTFMRILNTCEFARYAPVKSDMAMDNLYNETLEVIGEMENQLKLKNSKRRK